MIIDYYDSTSRSESGPDYRGGYNYLLLVLRAHYASYLRLYGLMAKSKLKSIAIKLVSTANTGYFYVTRKNPKKTLHKLALRKYDPVVRQHVLFTESKMR